MNKNKEKEPDASLTLHILIQPKGHAHVADFDGIEVAPDHDVARFHIAV